jgi:solute carrier family 30 (zinc transporter), member 9
MGVYLARLNQKYLLGQAVDSDITVGIRKILASRPSIDEVHSEQSQWIGPYAFAYKAEVDFDGTYLAAKLLRRYQNEFMGTKKLSSDEVKLLLAWYAEDVMRTVEQEVKDCESEIQRKYPEALYIELEPDSRLPGSYAIDEGRDAPIRKIEIETINQLQADFRSQRVEETGQEMERIEIETEIGRGIMTVTEHSDKGKGIQTETETEIKIMAKVPSDT